MVIFQYKGRHRSHHRFRRTLERPAHQQHVGSFCRKPLCMRNGVSHERGSCFTDKVQHVARRRSRIQIYKVLGQNQRGRIFGDLLFFFSVYLNFLRHRRFHRLVGTVGKYGPAEYFYQFSCFIQYGNIPSRRRFRNAQMFRQFCHGNAAFFFQHL